MDTFNDDYGPNALSAVQGGAALKAQLADQARPVGAYAGMAGDYQGLYNPNASARSCGPYDPAWLRETQDDRIKAALGSLGQKTATPLTPLQEIAKRIKGLTYRELMELADAFETASGADTAAEVIMMVADEFDQA